MSDDYDEFKNFIVDSAREVFAKFGYRKTTVEDIASSVGKAKSSIYHYFNGKEDIFRAVIEKEVDQILKDIRNEVEMAQSPVEKIKTFMLTAIIKVKETSNYYSFMKEEWYDIFDFANDMRNKSVSKMNDVLIKILRDGNNQGVFNIKDYPGKAKAIQLALSGLISPWSGINQEEIDESIDHFLDIVLYGLIKRNESASIV